VSLKAAVICLVTLVAIGVGACGHAGTAHPVAASRPQVEAFLAEAKHGSSGTFTLTYEVTVRYGRSVVRRVVVDVAQRSSEMFSYRMTPSLELSRPGGPPANSSYEVFSKPASEEAPGPGIYSCRKRLPASPWTCEGPYTQIGMGGMNQLFGPYPPQALVLGLDNAVAVYTDTSTVIPVRREPAFIITRRVLGSLLRCLQFGPLVHPVGRVCLGSGGLIAAYQLSETVTSGAWEGAVLRTYSPHVSAGAFALPAKPTASH
jgi:hypothetical protein